VAEAKDWVDPPPYEFRQYGLFAASKVIEAERPYLGTITWEQDACTMSGNYALCVPTGAPPANAGTGTLTAVIQSSSPQATVVQFTIAGMSPGIDVQFNPGDGMPLTPVKHTDGSGNVAPFTYSYLNPGVYNASASNSAGTNAVWTQVVIDKTLMPKVVDGPQYGEARGFAVTNGITCNKPGLIDARMRAQKRLMWTEERQVELCLMSGQAGNFPYLAGWGAGQPGGVQVLTPGSGVLSLVDALGWLEGELGMQLGPQGLIHAARYLAPSFAAAWQTQLSGPPGSSGGVSRSTTVGTKYVFGAGYPALGPDGQPPAAGTSWIYASGPIVIRRGPVITTEVFGGAAATPTNKVTVLVERQYTIEMDCPILAVQCSVPAPPHLP